MKYTINYDDAIVPDHAIASGSVPINYDYAKIEANKLTIDNQGNEAIGKLQRVFWDGGIASNTPLKSSLSNTQEITGYERDGNMYVVLRLQRFYSKEAWPHKGKRIFQWIMMVLLQKPRLAFMRQDRLRCKYT